MGKKKFDKSNSVTFKLVYKSSDDQDNADKTLSERIFSVIEADKKKAIQENDKARQKILSQFTNEELGRAPPKSGKNIQKETVSHKDNISAHAKGRNDLWITHLMRMKEQAKAEVDMEEEEKEEQRKREKMLALLKKKQATKKTVKKETKKEEEDDEEGEEDEEWESCDEEDEEGEEEEEDEQVEIEEWEEEEEEYEEEEEHEKEDKKEIMYKKVIEGKGRADDIVITDEPVIPADDFPALGAVEPENFVKVEIPEIVKTKEKVQEEIAEEEINLKKVKVVGDVKLKRYDDMGLPIDGYNYYQHVVDANSGGVPSFSFTVQYDQLQILPEDTDLKKEKMNAEEKELYEALEYTDNPGYEEIEDDFFNMLTKENHVAVEEGDANIQSSKKVTFKKDEDIKEILMSKDEPKADDSKKGGKDSILKRNDFQKVLQQHVDLLKDKYKEERAKNKKKYGLPEESEEEEEVEEVESFDEEDETNRPKEYVEKLSYKDDIAMQQAMAESEGDENDDDEQYEREISKNSVAVNTRPHSDYVSTVGARKANLNIIKEAGKPQKEGSEAQKQKEGDKEEEDEDDEEEEEDGNKVEEVFKKRERGETKEEKKERKALIKQFKQERKEKKKNFKENFENKKKAHIKATERQVSKLQGYSIYKLTV